MRKFTEKRVFLKVTKQAILKIPRYGKDRDFSDFSVFIAPIIL
jgi:hypothetical protein